MRYLRSKAKTRIPVALTIWITLAWASPTSARPNEPAPDVFVGYVHREADGLNYQIYTHLCHAFVTAKADGRIVPNGRVPNGRFVTEAHEHGVRVLLSLGGWGWDAQFTTIVSDPKAEDRLVEDVLAIVARDRYDGLDLDWEYPDTPEEVVGFERLTRRLRSGLDEIAATTGRRMELTMAASANPATLDWLTNEFLLETMDWVNVMTYDFSGAWTGYAGHNAPFKPSGNAPPNAGSVTTTLEHLLDRRGFPADRLALGLPLYGRAYSVSKPYASTQGTERPGRTKTYAEAVRLLDSGWSRTWDSETQTPWLRAPGNDVVLAYDDADSVRLKTQWAKERGLRGVFFWEVSQDRDDAGVFLLQEAAKAAWATPK